MDSKLFLRSKNIFLEVSEMDFKCIEKIYVDQIEINDKNNK